MCGGFLWFMVITMLGFTMGILWFMVNHGINDSLWFIILSFMIYGLYLNDVYGGL